MDTRGPVRLVSLVSDVEWEHHIREALGPSSIIRWIRRESDFDADGLQSANVVLWHISPSPNAATTLAATLRRLQSAVPWSPIVLYCRVAPAVAQLLLVAARLGVHRAALRGYDDLQRVLADALHERRYDRACTEILGRLPEVDPPVRAAMAYSIRYAFDGGLSVEALARALQIDRKTLHNHLRRSGLPPAAAVISWSRLLAAGWLLEDRQQTVTSTARLLHFASVSELRGMLSRYVRCTATQLRDVGALQTIADAFRGACTHSNHSGRSAVSPAIVDRTVVTSPRTYRIPQ